MRPLLVTASLVAVATPLIATAFVARGAAPAAARSTSIAAEPAPTLPPLFRPRLTILNPQPGEGELGISKVDIAMRIDGPLAQTSMTLTFRNDTNRVLEGNLDFPLPENAVLSGYALDVNGTLIDGVPVEKNEARQIFETEERHRVDPGLLQQKGNGNNFQTRIYPLPPHGARIIRIEYVTDLQTVNGGDMRYIAPLRWDQTIPDAHFRLSVTHEPVAPVLNFGGRESVLQISPVGGGLLNRPSAFTMDKDLQGVPFTSDLTVTLPGLGSQSQLAIEPFQLPPLPGPDTKTPIIKRGPEDFFAFADAPPLPPAAPAGGFSKEAPHIGVIWDASLSRLHANRQRELQLLSDALHKSRHATVDVTILRNVLEPTKTFTIDNGDCTALMSFLSVTPCDGGTDLSALRFPRATSGGPIDAYLLFTDGLDTLAGDPPSTAGAPVYAVATDPRADHSLLRRLSERSGGAYLNLTQMTDPEAVAAMGRTPYSLLTVAVVTGSVTDIFPDSAQPIQGRVTVSGRLRSTDAEIALVYGYRNLISGNDQVTARKTVALHHSDSTPANGLIARYWARQKAAALGLRADKNHDALIALGHDFNIVTPTTSMLVLENLDQYIRYNVQPPTTQMPLLIAWIGQRNSTRQNEAEARRDKIASVLAMWKEKVDWYNSPPIITKKEKVDREGRNDLPMTQATPSHGRMAQSGSTMRYAAPLERALPSGESDDSAAPAAPPAIAQATVSFRREAGESHQRAATDSVNLSFGAGLATGRHSAAKAVSASNAPLIDADDFTVAETAIIKAWSPDTPYLKELRAAGPANAYAAYLKQRGLSGYENSPAFYLDCAEYLIRAGQPALGARVLTSILDLRIEEPSLIRIVAHRMTQLGYRDAGIRLFDSVLRMRPEEPQSYRDLALALSDRADDEMTHGSPVGATADDDRALSLLNDVITRPWDGRFPEIESIAIDEANRIVAVGAAHALRLTDPIDSRLTRNLPCDLRILLTWNTDETDQDLWVTEPTGEKCYYAYNRTTIGGRLSHDFTQGYGPEEYLLRKAVHGKYVIQTNYYGQHSPEIDGGTTVQATVITNWGRPTEKREYLTVRVNQAKDVVDIGNVVR